MCLLVCVLAVYIYLNVCLIFCSGFVICVIVFFGKLAIFAFFNFFAGFVGAVAVILANNRCRNSVLFAFRASNVCNVAQRNSFCDVSAFCYCFFCVFRAVVFFSSFCLVCINL